MASREGHGPSPTPHRRDRAAMLLGHLVIRVPWQLGSARRSPSGLSTLVLTVDDHPFPVR